MQLYISVSLGPVLGSTIWQGYWFMQTPRPCCSFHMNPLLNMSSHRATKYLSVNKYWDINNICRARQQAVQGVPLLYHPIPRQTVFSPPWNLKRGLWNNCPPLLQIEYRKVPLWHWSPWPLLMCPAVSRLEVNCHLTGLPFVVLESAARRAHSVNVSQREILVADTQYFVKMADDNTSKTSSLLPPWSAKHRRGDQSSV